MQRELDEVIGVIGTGRLSNAQQVEPHGPGPQIRGNDSFMPPASCHSPG